MGDSVEKAFSSFSSTEEAPHLEIKQAYFSLFNTEGIIPQRKSSYLSLISPTLYLLNMMSLLMPSKVELADYSNAYWLFNALNCIRLDGLAWNIGLEVEVGVLTLTSVFMTSSSIAFLVYVQYFKLKINARFKDAVRSVFIVSTFKAYSEALLVPVFCMLISMIKYGFSNSTRTEYVNSNSNSVGELLALLSAVALPLFTLEVAVSVRTLYNISFNKTRHQWFARSHSHVHTRIVMVVLAQCIFLYSHDVNAPQIYFTFCAASQGYLTYLHYKCLPYYNDITNTLYIGMGAFLTNVSIASIIAIYVNSSTVIVLTCFIMLPCYLLISHGLVQRRLYNFSQKKPKDCNTPFEFMPILRQKLVLFEDDSVNYVNSAVQEEIKQAMIDLCTKFPTYRLANLWESLYYHFIEKNPSLAQTKLSKHGVSGSFEIQFLSYHISNLYDGLIKSEDVAFLRWLKQIAQVKEDDRKLCGQLLTIYDMLLASKNDANSISEHLIQTYELLLKTKNTYKRLTQVYSKSPEVLDLFGRFMVDILSDSTGNQYLMFGKSEKSSRSRSFVPINQITSLFNADVGIIVIGGAVSEIGAVVYVNEEAARLLGLNPSQMLGLDLNQFIPPPYCNNHNSKLLEFLEFGTTNHIFRSHLVLYSMDLYDVEVTYEVKALTLNCKPYFLTAVRGKPGNRELAVFDSNGLITSCTRNFENLYGNGHRLEGINLEALFPGLWDKRNEYPDFVPFILPVDERPLIMMFTFVTLRLSKVKFLYIIRSADALEELLEGKVVDSVYGPWINTIKENLAGQTRRAARSKGMPVDLSKKVLFSDNKRLGSNHTLDSHASQDVDINITSISSAHSEIRMDRFRKMRDETMLRARKVKIILGVAFIFVFGILIGMLVSFNFIITETVDIDNITQIGSRRILAIKIASASRTLQLIEAGRVDGATADVVTSLRTYIDDLFDAENVAETVRKSGVSLGKDEEIPIWVWQPFMTQNLVTGREAIRQLLSQAESLTASTTDNAVLYSLRNGVGETLAFLNQTVYEYVAQHTDSEFKSVEFIASLMLGGLMCIIAAYIGILAPTIYHIESGNHKVYNQLKNIKRSSIVDARHRVQERLELVHCQEQIHTDRERQRPEAYKLLWPMLALKFCLFVTVTLMVVMIAYLVYSNILETMVLTNYNYSFWAGTRIASTLSSYFWCRELILSRQGFGFHEIMPENQLFYSYDESIKNSTSTLQWVHRALMHRLKQANLGISDESSAAVSILFDTYDTEITELDYGVHNGILEFLAQIRDFTANPTQEGLDQIELLSGTLTEGMEQLITIHCDYTDKQLDKARLAFSLTLFGYAVILELLYLYYAHVIKRTSLYIVSVARLLPLLPEADPNELNEK